MRASRIAYVMPTRDRPGVLAQTLDALGALPAHEAQVIVVDNASTVRADVPRMLANGIGVEVVRLEHNAGAAGRNAGVMASDRSCGWIVMLDDDSAPVGMGHVEAVGSAREDVAAVCAEIWLTNEEGIKATRHQGIKLRRESGGLPEVFVGCGVAVRRGAFVECGGYDAAFGYYAEEYDLSAKLLMEGWRVEMDRRFVVEHRKVAGGRDMNVILSRLVRNNGWVMQRYAPARRRVGEISRVVSRYGAIARKEDAEAGYSAGVRELARTLRDRARGPMGVEIWERFTGKAAAREAIGGAWRAGRFATAAVVEDGKNSHIVREVLRELGVREVRDERGAEAVVIGTLSPGPMLDALEARRGQRGVVAPWEIGVPRGEWEQAEAA